jgi:AcrR family transcriptional regulator
MSRQAETATTDAASVQQATTGGRMAAEERRLQIVKVAMRLFSERGFRGTTTKEIAIAAGVSEAIIFRHFATKEDLYTAIIDFKACAGMGASPVASASGQPFNVEAIRECVGDLMTAGDDRAVFQGLALSMMEHHQSDPEFLRLLMYSALEGHQLAQIFWDKNVRVLYEYLGDYMRRRQREGAFRDVNPFIVVRAFTGAIIHHSLNNILWDRDPARRILNIGNEEAAREFAEILLRGITADAVDKKTAASKRVERGGKSANAKNRNGASRKKNKKR